MTQEEFDFFQHQMSKAKQKTQTDFFLAVLRKKSIIVIEDLREVLQELKRHGNNLNQIARRLNETNYFDENSIAIMNDCWQTYRSIREIEKGVRNAVIQGKIKQGEAEKGD
jgi:hypothetical protein